MRSWVVAVLLASGVAHADTAEELEAKGEAFAKDGHFSDAIDAFKAADRIAPRASHVCLIALAYTRRELWPQAEIFLDKCHERATSVDPLPGWVPLADKQLAERLASANVAAVTIVVEPKVPATLTASSFAPDETFAPRTIHLAPGHHVISVSAAGYEHAQQAIDITDRTAQQVVVKLSPIGIAPLPRVVAAPRSKLPWIVMGAGGAIALAGLATHLFALEPIRDKLQSAEDHNDPVEYAMYSKSFDSRRTATLVLYGVGAAAIVAGAVLHVTVFKQQEVAVAVAPTAGGAMIGLEVRR